MHAGYSYLDSDIEVGSTVRDDGIFLLMPRHTFSLWSTYDVTSNFVVGAGINAMSSIESSQGVRGAGYATIDAMVSYQVTDRLQLQLNVDNLANRKYYTRVGSFNTFNIPGKERTAKANISYRF
jgi:iron complex outermembrane receptor protein/outer membrane receptor for ferric coprogen and ferric-rhodotorulic acid